MTPEYIEHLADLADPAKLWKASPLAELSLEQARQRDTGIALRRYASHVRQLHSLIGTGYSMLLTPRSPNVVQKSSLPTPAQHAQRAKPSDPLGP